MISLIKQKNQIKANFITYYQEFLAISTLLVFFTRLDIYLANNYGFLIPLYWML
jgi:hypothetical protein